jgi:hypothetical protein
MSLRIADGVHARRFGDEVVLVDVRRGIYFSLNAVGSVVWQSLAAGSSIEAAVDAVVATFDVTVEAAALDAASLVADLRAAGLLEERA